jgi:predicted DNA-binding transcriptional regulator AlpA
MAGNDRIGRAVPEESEDRFLTRQEAADMLGLAVSTLATWRSQGRSDAPPMHKFGRSARYSQRELREWSEQRRA